MTDKLITTYKDKITGLTLVPSDGGRFEFSIDGSLVYSKLETGEFPEWEQIKAKVDAAV